MENLEPVIFEGIDPELPIIIAGPCSAESQAQMLETAEGVAAAGVKIFRAGIWKPRTQPGGFEGIGHVGLQWLNEVKERFGLYTATEVATRAHVEAALAAGVDILWIGARTSANPFAVQEVADALKASGRAAQLTVFVKNPVNPDLELWIGAMKRIYNAGVRRLGAIHRGFTSYGQNLYRNEPMWRIPIELRRRYPQLPLICDPSHMGGRRELIAPLAQQAYDMCFNGLMIETHCNPDCALSDKAQQVTPDALSLILKSLVVRDCSSSTESLDELRRRIDATDDELLAVLARRMNIAREIGLYKREHSMPVIQTDRYNTLMHQRVEQGVEMGLGEEFIRTVLAAVHEESVRQQINHLPVR